jgi:hypothetical protein
MGKVFCLTNQLIGAIFYLLSLIAGEAEQAGVLSQLLWEYQPLASRSLQSYLPLLLTQRCKSYDDLITSVKK